MPRDLSGWIWLGLCVTGAAWLGFTYCIIVYAHGFKSPILLAIMMGYMLYGGVHVGTKGRPRWME